jgi:hypothetical protein
MNHPLYPWVDPRNRRGTGHCRRRPGLPVSSALLLARWLAMACCFPRWHASLLPRRVCVFPLGFVFLCYGELRGEMHESSTQAVELGTFFLFLFFFSFFCFGPFSFHAKLNTVRNTAGDRKSTRERGKSGRERERDRRDREK